jgi:hypothetical protein
VPAVAFFPWLKLREPLTVGSVRLIPWERGESPCDTAAAKQADLDAVLSAYANRPNQVVTGATLLEVADWCTGMDVTPEIRRELFRFRDLIGFSALSKRELFAGHFGYTNFDSYQLVIQNYEAGRGGRFTFAVKRRDGWASHYWTADDFAFGRPHHVGAHEFMDLDLPLLSRLVQSDFPDRVYDAIVEFNQANTDSPDVQTHLELIRAKTSMEWLLNVGDKYQDLQRELVQLLPQLEQLDGPLRVRWEEQYPNSETLITRWAQEFCVRRSMSAHATKRSSSRRVWSEEAHLAFYSVLFPLLVKKSLAGSGAFELGMHDRIRLRRLEAYLVVDPYQISEEAAEEDRWPWREIDGDIRMRTASLEIEKTLREALQRLPPLDEKEKST